MLEFDGDIDMKVAVGQRDNGWGPPLYNAFGEANTMVHKYGIDADGLFKIRGKARHIRLRTYLNGTFNKAQGIYVTGDQARGKR